MCYVTDFFCTFAVSEIQNKSNMKKFISYTRVSTSKQGLGLEAQTATIESYVKNQSGTIIGSYSEKESGKETINRHELQKAIAQAKAEEQSLLWQS